MSETPNPYTSSSKAGKLVKFYKEGNYPPEGKQPKKVNLATAAELENSKLANTTDFKTRLDKKPTKNVSNVIINVGQDKNRVQLVPLSSLNLFDTSNPGKLIHDDKYIDNICKKITEESNAEKVIVLGGDLFGWQWKMSELAKADITQDNKVLWWGINTRLIQLKKIIKKCLKTDAHVILMRGAQENQIMKVLDGRDVLQEVIDDIQKNEKIENKKLYYVNEGVSEIIQFAKANEKGKVVYYPVELRTNNALSKATTVRGYFNASQKNNGVAVQNILSLDFNGNIVGQLDEQFISVSPEKAYKETAKMKKPSLSSKMNNELNLFLEDNGSISVVQGKAGFEVANEEIIAGEKRLNEMIRSNEILQDLINEKIENQINKNKMKGIERR